LGLYKKKKKKKKKLISQGKYRDINGQYDNNYYYPSSEGKGIDNLFL